jgi:peptide/nickel transport system ATP-binding protein
MPEPLLDVSGLTVAFPGFRAVDDLDFSVGAGETLAIAGESGSGKSMTALAIMGLTPRGADVKARSIRLAGREISGLPEREMRKLRGRDIGLIFQEPMTALNPVMSVGDQVAEVARIHLGLSRRARSNCSTFCGCANRTGWRATTRINCRAACARGSSSRSRLPPTRSW